MGLCTVTYDTATCDERSPRRRRYSALFIGFWLCLHSPFIYAETGFLVVVVNDVQKHPIIGLEIQETGTAGDASSALTDQKGKARIRMAPTVKESSWVSLKIVKSPHWMMVSPWDSRAQVPSFGEQIRKLRRSGGGPAW
jgi:hypothetical protein